MVVAPATTWWLVTTSPSEVSTMPVPAASPPAYFIVVAIRTNPVICEPLAADEDSEDCCCGTVVWPLHGSAGTVIRPRPPSDHGVVSDPDPGMVTVPPLPPEAMLLSPEPPAVACEVDPPSPCPKAYPAPAPPTPAAIAVTATAASSRRTPRLGRGACWGGSGGRCGSIHCGWCCGWCGDWSSMCPPEGLWRATSTQQRVPESLL